MADGSLGTQRTQQEEVFEEWLNSRMKQLGLDEDVFGSYVTGVLDSDDTDEDRKDALIGILDGMTVWIYFFTRARGSCAKPYHPMFVYINGSYRRNIDKHCVGFELPQNTKFTLDDSINVKMKCYTVNLPSRRSKYKIFAQNLYQNII